MKTITTLLLSVLPISLYCQAWRIVDSGLVMAKPPFQACHASTIVEPAPGELLLSFFAGTRESANDVSIWLTSKKRNRWTKPQVVATGIVHDSLRYACWNPVLFKSATGNLFLFYKVGPNPREWWGEFKFSVDNGTTWSRAQKLPTGILGPIKNKPIRLHDGTIVSPSSVESEDSWKVHIEKSADEGKTWQKIPVDTASNYKVIQPAILQHRDSVLQMVCRSDQDHIITSWSYNKGETWTKFSKLHLLNPNSGIDAVTLNDGTHMLVYNPTTRGKDWWNNRGKLHVAISDNGTDWRDVAILENGTTEEYSYPAIIQASDGKVHITYTYDRKNMKHVVLQKTDK